LVVHIVWIVELRGLMLVPEHVILRRVSTAHPSTMTTDVALWTQMIVDRRFVSLITSRVYRRLSVRIVQHIKPLSMRLTVIVLIRVERVFFAEPRMTKLARTQVAIKLVELLIDPWRYSRSSHLLIIR